MRTPDLNVKSGIAKQFSTELSLKLYERICLVRWFEKGLIEVIKKKGEPKFVYLSTGQEAVAAALSFELRSYMIFAQHRAHDIYLTFGGNPVMLRDELMGLPAGTSQGKGGSNCLQYHMNGLTMFGHHGLIGENVPLGVGAALASGRKTVCFFGDGSAEEDYVLAAMGFAVTHKLPVYFVCVDNDLSILTTTDVRRSWEITKIAKGFGMPCMDVADDPWSIMHYTKELTENLPALINCRVCRNNWHVGIGTDGPPEWERHAMVKQELIQLGHKQAIDEIEDRVQRSMENLWKKEL